MKKRVAVFSMAGVVALGLLSGPAQAKGTDVITRGACSASSDWKLKLSPENGRIEVEFEVDQNVVGQVWKVSMTDNGNVFFQGNKTTQAPSGSFEARALTANRAGADKVVAQATNAKTGEVCKGVATARF